MRIFPKTAAVVATVAMGLLSSCAMAVPDNGETRLESLRDLSHSDPANYPTPEMVSHILPLQMEDVPSRDQVVELYRKLEDTFIQGNDRETQEQLYPVEYYATYRYDGRAREFNDVKRAKQFEQNFFNQYEFEGPVFSDVTVDLADGSDAVARVAHIKGSFKATDNSDPSSPTEHECSRVYTLVRTPIPRSYVEEKENRRPEANPDNERSSAEQPLIWRFDEIVEDTCADLTDDSALPFI